MPFINPYRAINKSTNALFAIAVTIFLLFLLLIASLISSEFFDSLDNDAHEYTYDRENKANNKNICANEMAKMHITAEFIDFYPESGKMLMTLVANHERRCANILQRGEVMDDYNRMYKNGAVVVGDTYDYRQNIAMEKCRAKKNILLDVSGNSFLYPLDSYNSIIYIGGQYPELKSVGILPTSIHLVHGKNPSNMNISNLSIADKASDDHHVKWNIEYSRPKLLQLAGISGLLMLVFLIFFNVGYAAYVLKKKINSTSIYILWAIFNAGIIISMYNIFPLLDVYRNSLICYILHISTLIAQMTFIFMSAYLLLQKIKRDAI